MRPLPVQPVAGTPPYVVGLAIIRGAAVPVVNPSRLLRSASSPGPGASASGAERFFTLRTGDRVVAIAVDAILGIRALPASSQRALPPLLREAASDGIASIGTLDAELLLLLQAVSLVPGDLPAAVSGAAP